MPPIDAFNILKWVHFIFLAMAGGGAVVALLLSGFELEHPELQGLAATVWKKTATWGFRLALLVGIGLAVMKFMRHDNPFDHYYFHAKLLLVVLLLGVAEMAPKMLAAGKRGAAMAALFFFLLTTFIVYNKDLFGGKAPARSPEPAPTAGTTFQAR